MSVVSLHEVSYRSPDGRLLFERLDLSFGPERCGLIGRNGVGKSTLLKLILGELAPAAGTIRRAGRIRALDQQPAVAPGTTVADRFGLGPDLARLARALAGTAAAAELAEVDWTLEHRLEAALAQVGLAGLPPERPLAALSGGQRTRVALAALTFADPEMVLLDEPTNDLDRTGRALVAGLLARLPGGAVVVSHDRELLAGMDRIVELSDLGARTYGGGWEFYAARRAGEREAAAQRLESARREVVRVERQAQIARERQARRDARGRDQALKRLNTKSFHDAQQERAENSRGESARGAARRQARAIADLQEAEARVERVRRPRVALPEGAARAGKVVLSLARVSAGYDPESPVLRDLSFEIVGPERVAVTGANGSGKSTLLKLAAGALAPFAGDLRRPARAALLDQQVALLAPGESVLANFRRLNPGAGENAARAALARFLFRNAAAERPVAGLSGGERLRAGLACVLGGETAPDLLALDEPTNHLDLDAVAALEAGLTAYAGALLVASHDEVFLAAIGITRRLALPAGHIDDTLETP